MSTRTMSTWIHARWTILSRLLMVVAMMLALGADRSPVLGQTKDAELTSGWVKVNSDEGGFSALYPGQPHAHSEELQMIGMRVVMNILSSSRTQEESASVGYMDAPVTIGADSFLRVLIKGEEDHFAAGGGKAESRDVSAGTCNGKESIIRNGTKLYASRIYLSGSRLYVVAYLSASESQDTIRYARAFLDSFEVKGGCKPVEEARKSQTLSTTVDGETDAATGWKKIQSDEDQFSILMPSTATVKEERVETGGHTLVLRSYASAGDTEFTIVVTVRGSYSSGSETAVPESALDMAGLSMIEGLKARGMDAAFLESAKVGSHPARVYALKMHGLSGKGWLLSSHGRVYLFAMICRQETGCEEGLNSFLFSIKVAGE